MAISQLKISNLRNIRAAHLAPVPGINLIFGENGSGKTSLLEAIHLLGLGRSFRSSKPGPVIHNDSEEMTIFGEIYDDDRGQSHRLGVNKSRRGESALRLDGKPITSAAALAQSLPVLTLNSDSFDLIAGPPKPRRRIIDWLAFHVEPQYLGLWRQLQHCLKQRNSLLRRGKIASFELQPWDDQLVSLGQRVDEIRKQSFALFIEAFNSIGELTSSNQRVELTYIRGWNAELSLQDALAHSEEQDRLRGYTQVGPHRADLKITTEGAVAAERLSRGQQKMAICAFLLAQGAVYAQQVGRPCVYLVDDLPSELDRNHRHLMARWLSELGAQVFVTGIELEPLLDMWSGQHNAKTAKKFHVEQGRINEIQQ